MFCPQCGAPQSDEVRFCKACGVNLNAVRQVVVSGEAGEKFDWSKTWVAEMFLSETARKQRAAELERARGITPEVKRYNEIKAGVITSFVGLAVAIVLFIIGGGIARSGQLPADEVEIVTRAWIIGVIPFLVGLGIIFNGLFVSKKIVEVERRERQLAPPPAEAPATEPLGLRPGDTSEFIPTNLSVTEGTTEHLRTPARKGEVR